MECSLCYEVVHPSCVTDQGVEGYIKMEVPSTWECPKCVKSGRAAKLEPTSQFTPSGLPVKKQEPDSDDGPSPAKVIKTESVEEKKEPMAYGRDSTFTGPQLFSVTGSSDRPKHELRAALAEQILAASSRPLREAPHVVRPPPRERLAAEEVFERRRREDVDLRLERAVMLQVFARLDTVELSKCVLVCRSWCRIMQDPLLWQTVRLCNRKVTSHLLSLIVQRQPVKLQLDFSTVSKQQLSWLLPRIPQTR